ncbi:MAG TPA: sugar phosphate isomerase/epimerase family protein [Capsulimonadaceae bacterium]|nr:sugar phosphate isomerase/epimerase family protein [Capsulimonadaceae bacterium]
MLLKSINYWSLPGGLEGTLAIGSFLETAKKYEYDAVELCIGDSDALSLDTDRETCLAIREQAEQMGLPIPSVASGLYWSYCLASATSADRERAVKALERMIRITSWLGARTLLTIPGSVDIFFKPEQAPMAYDEVWNYTQEGLNRVLGLAEEMGVRLGIENVWNRFLLSPLEMARFIDSFNSRAIGAYVDVGNVLLMGYPEQWLTILGDRVAGIHFKDFRRAVGTAEGFVDLLEGDVDWPEVMDAIKRIRYEGPLVAELIPLYKHYPEMRAANASRAMDAIMGRAS